VNPRRSPIMGVVREALIVAGCAAAAAELMLGLVGGLPAAATGAVVIAALALVAARYISGADAVDSDYRRKVRLVGSREPTLRYWDAAIEDARESLTGYELHLCPLLQRLYAVRLAERHGVSLHGQPDRAAALVGAELWPWIDPSRSRLTADPLGRAAVKAGDVRRPEDRRPVPDPLLTALVERLEQL
jgi:hypothetical protein